ncbi:MAG: CHASE domain-containing protein [Candidatus Omnitrophota bacterium]
MKSEMLHKSFLNHYAGLIVLALGLAIIASATLAVRKNVEKTAQREFIAQSEVIRNSIVDRIEEHARILFSAAALFNVTDTVTREQWRIFNKQQKIENQLPGIQGIGFSLLIPREDLAKHIQDIRREDFLEYKIKPDGERDVYTSIIYLEPFTGRNLRAFGYDMFSEPIRRKAMEQARDTDSAALSGKVRLVQETDKEVQAGTLMYVPVYRKGMPTDSLKERRAAIVGWVYSPYRMGDLMKGILGSGLLNNQLHLQVFDGAQLTPESLLFEKGPSAKVPAHSVVRFTLLSTIDFNGQHWTLRFTKTGEGLLTVEYLGVWLVLFSGIFIILLLFALIRSLEGTRRRAQQLAEELTVDLRQVSDRLHLASTAGGVGIWDWDVVNNKLVWDEQMYQLYGTTADQFSGAYDAWRTGLHSEDSQRGDNEIQMALRGEKEFDTEFRVRWPNGAVHYIRALAIVQRDDSGKPLRMIGTNWDITEEHRKEEEIRKLNEEFKGRIKESMEELVHVSRIAILGQIAAAVAHELNQPLGAILNWVSSARLALTKEKPDIEMVKKILTNIVEADMRAADVIKKIRGLVKKERNEFKRVNIENLIWHVINLMKTDAVLKGVAVDVELNVTDAFVLGDNTQLQQVLINLILNAVEASSKKVDAGIKVKADNKKEGFVTVSVVDFGEGLKISEIEKIFQPFHTTKEEGLGIGLFVCRSIIQSHEGELGVFNNDKGATFFFRLPLIKDSGGVNDNG